MAFNVCESDFIEEFRLYLTYNEILIYVYEKTYAPGFL